MMLTLAAKTAARSEVEATGVDLGEFRSFYENALPSVYGYLIHRCGDAAVAEDLTQESFVAVVAAMRDGRRYDLSLPWLLGIARHKLVDHFRRQARAAQTLPVDDTEERGPELDISAADARERAFAALNEVAPSQRAVLVLRYLDGFTVGEIAEALGRSEEAVESLLVRGRASFKRAYLKEST